MRATTHASCSLRELARRTTDGVDVTLLWEQATGVLTVCVTDERCETRFELHPRPEQALDCFYHPYFYATLDAGLQLGELSLDDAAYAITR
jgi:hypothetical protein